MPVFLFYILSHRHRIMCVAEKNQSNSCNFSIIFFRFCSEVIKYNCKIRILGNEVVNFMISTSAVIDLTHRHLYIILNRTG